MRSPDSGTMRETSMSGGGPTAAEARASEAVEATVKTLKTGPYQVLPDLTNEEYEALKASIAAHGMLVPIEVDEQGNVLHGHHRLKAARELGLADKDIPINRRSRLSEEEKLEFVLRVNLVRRHLTREQKQALAVQLRQQRWTQERIAGALGVSQQTVSNWLRDVTKIGDVDAESGKPPLPATITDTLGRRQPAQKLRRQPSTVAKRPDGDEGTASPGGSPPAGRTAREGAIARCFGAAVGSPGGGIPDVACRVATPSPCFGVGARPGPIPHFGGGANGAAGCTG